VLRAADASDLPALISLIERYWAFERIKVFDAARINSYNLGITTRKVNASTNNMDLRHFPDTGRFTSHRDFDEDRCISPAVRCHS
jgi:hypothetical protein